MREDVSLQFIPANVETNVSYRVYLGERWHGTCSLGSRSHRRSGWHCGGVAWRKRHPTSSIGEAARLSRKRVSGASVRRDYGGGESRSHACKSGRRIVDRHQNLSAKNGAAIRVL